MIVVRPCPAYIKIMEGTACLVMFSTVGVSSLEILRPAVVGIVKASNTMYYLKHA